MDPATRTLKRITVADVQRAENMFKALMGESSSMRKDFIERNAFRANIDI